MELNPDNCEPCQPQGLTAFGFRIGISLALAGQGMVFGLGYNNALKAGEAPAHGSPVYWILHLALIASALGVVALLGGPLFRETLQSIRSRRLSVEALFVLSAAGALGGSLISTIRGEGSVYYEVVSIVLCVYAIGRQIGAVQKGRIGQAVAAFRQAFDRATLVRADGMLQSVPVSEVGPEDRILVRPGEPVPVDGIIEEGGGYLRETSLTGEPAPVSRGTGDPVMAGTWSVDGTLYLRLQNTGGERKIDRILELLEAAPQAPSRLQETADRLMQVFVPLVSAVSTGTILGWLIFSDVTWPEALFNAMAVLLVACPCALGLAMPTGIWAGLYYLSQRGIVGRHGHLIDSLADCTTIVFDKTGTLSHFELNADTSRLQPPGGTPLDRDALVDAIASLGKASHHPVSAALAGLSVARLPVGHLATYPGKGLGGEVNGHHLLVGEAALLVEKGISFPDSLPQSADGKLVHVGLDGRYGGAVLLRESLRDEAEASLEALTQLGCTCRILSGDPAGSGKSFSGIPVEGGLSPGEKADRIRKWTRDGGRVLFVGDGVNDLPAMEASKAALAIDLGAALATEFADGVLVDGRINSLPAAVRHARHLKKSLSGNLIFALAYNLFGMALAAAGILHPVVAALLMVGSSVVVSYRALRAAAQVA